MPHRSRFGIRFVLLASIGLLMSACGGEDSPGPEWSAHAALGPGFLVWESNRTGHWRIWQRRLDGSDLRQLTPNEGERNHFAPHIAPDGRHLVYLSYPPGLNGYGKPRRDAEVTLRLLDLEDGKERMLAPRARTYYEDRAAVWIDDRSLIYIAGDGSTRRIDIYTREEEPLLPPTKDRAAFLMDPTLAHATTGKPAWNVYDVESRSVISAHRERGCQPYFTRDGRWGFWVVGGGGPVRRIDLRTDQREEILVRGDPRLPDDFGYLYFPMVSPGQDLIAFGASGNDHDHFRANYEIFVAPIDPENLGLTGKPLRYTFDSGTDRFPDVFRAGSELGRIRGEAPVSVALRIPQSWAGEGWRWDLGDGEAAAGRSVTHTYTRPGTYRFEARSEGGETVLGGTIHVENPEPPRPLRTRVQAGGLEVTVLFDEKVALRNATARFEKAGPATSIEVGPVGTSVRIRPARAVRESDLLDLQGVLDRGQPPQLMEPQKLVVEPQDWPRRDEGLAFLWHTADQRNLVRDATMGTDRSVALEARFAARLDRHFAMNLTGGGFRHENLAELAARIGESRAFTFEATLNAGALPAEKPGVVAAYSAAADDRRFALVQEGSRLAFYLRVAGGPNSGRRFPIAKLASRGPHHVTVTVRRGRLEAYLDGELVAHHTDVDTQLRTWRSADLFFGWERGGPNDWSGTLEGIAIYNRVLEQSEIQANARAYRSQLAERVAVNTLDVRARRIAASTAPTLEEILPYQNALVVHEYEVEEVLDGDLGDPRIRVAHWALLNGTRRPRADEQPGEIVVLRLEALEDHPQVKDVYTVDDLPLDPYEPVFLEPGS